MAFSLYGELFQVCGELFGRTLLSLDHQGNDVGILFDTLEDPLPFFFFDLRFQCFAGAVRCLFIRKLKNFKTALTGQPFTVLCNSVTVKFFLDFSDGN